MDMKELEAMLFFVHGGICATFFNCQLIFQVSTIIIEMIG